MKYLDIISTIIESSAKLFTSIMDTLADFIMNIIVIEGDKIVNEYGGL